jgi:RHS repeat-associated protein
MNLLIYALLFFFLCSFKEVDDEENPALFHHVNVITGEVNLAFQDTVVESAFPLLIHRGYTSAGALEKDADNIDLLLKNLRKGFVIQGGWSFFPHTHLLVQPGLDEKGYQVFASDPSGNITEYEYDKKIKKSAFCLRAKPKKGKGFGKICGRSDRNNSFMHMDDQKGWATLFFSDGTKQYFRGKENHLRIREGKKCITYYTLFKEELPSKKKILYEYDTKNRLKKIVHVNHDETITFCSLQIHLDKPHSPYQFRIHTSDEKEIVYHFKKISGRDYLCAVDNQWGISQKFEYVKDSRGAGARLSSFYFNDLLQCKISYYQYDKKNKHLFNKVRQLDAPLGPDGKMIPLARFNYFKNRTDVRDVDNLLIQYHHEDGRPTLIEYFDENDKIAYATRFIWSDTQISAKIKLGKNGQPLFSKTFCYDSHGNVIKETFWGNISGAAIEPFILQEDGTLLYAETQVKEFCYDAERHLLIEEKENQGLIYRYEYLADTDLLSAKFTIFDDRILLRQFFMYDDNFLLSKEITDDGTSTSPDEFTNVTERKIRSIAIDKDSGLTKKIIDSAVDLFSLEEKKVKSIALHYNRQHLICQEDIFDQDDHLRYSLYTDYDLKGNMISKTVPSGKKNIFTYDSIGRLTMSKEVGSQKKQRHYDLAGRMISEEEIDAFGFRQKKQFTYDKKGRCLSQIDHLGHFVNQKYDCFGKCIEAKLTSAIDEYEQRYTPTVTFTYDECGNLASTTNPKGETTSSLYTSFHLPYQVISADRKITTHSYDPYHCVNMTTHPDGTYELQQHDPFKRITYKACYSSFGDLLCEEKWVYNAFHLLSYQNITGQITYYHYDIYGRLIRQITGERKVSYSYDLLGFQDKIFEKGICHITTHDEEGKVLATWDEDPYGKKERHTTYFYDGENRKVKACRITSCGIAEDFFHYDAKGRLSEHIDPMGHATQFFFDEEHTNLLGQNILIKKMVDAQGTVKAEFLDPQGRVEKVEKISQQGQILSCERLYYDRAGNIAKKVADIFENGCKIKEHALYFSYDLCGRLLEENEENKKRTLYSYNDRGWIASKTKADGICITYQYDGLGRVIHEKSSYGSIDYEYEYSCHEKPTFVIDKVSGISWQRLYDDFGNILSEKVSDGLYYQYQYDPWGRCTHITLPDQSFIHYDYLGDHLQEIKRGQGSGHIYSHRYMHYDESGFVEKEELAFDLGTLCWQRDLLERYQSSQSPYHSCMQSYSPLGLVINAFNSFFGSKKYQYDALQQLSLENDMCYQFNSLGNPVLSLVGDCNELLQKEDHRLSYDAEGRPLCYTSSLDHKTFSYDALGRLTKIVQDDGSTIYFCYDPFSRLFSKEENGQKLRYLYQQDIEIGTIDCEGHIQQLKILGCGINADIGAAVALEIDDSIFIPLHDLKGNICAIIDTEGHVVESYFQDAFGHENKADGTIFTNPWRFSSKRHEGELIFFGLRFFVPQLQRWLTPDPAGYIDGHNLYLFNLNSPTNRLDLFGLHAEPLFPFQNIHAEVPIYLLSAPSFNQVQALKGSIDGVEVDWIIKGGDFSKLTFTPEELQEGKINLFHHFHELIPAEGKQIGLISFQNGIQTSLAEAKQMVSSLSLQSSQETLILSLYSPSSTLFKDLNQASCEIKKMNETSMTALTRQYFTAVTTSLYKINPDAMWMHVAHSRAGGIAARAIEGMSEEQLTLMQKNFIYLGIGPTVPMKKDFCLASNNIYSTKDRITGIFGKMFKNDPSYNIQFLMCQTPLKDRISQLLLSDHSFMGKTYSNRESIEHLMGRFPLQQGAHH